MTTLEQRLYFEAVKDPYTFDAPVRWANGGFSSSDLIRIYNRMIKYGGNVADDITYNMIVRMMMITFDKKNRKLVKAEREDLFNIFGNYYSQTADNSIFNYVSGFWSMTIDEGITINNGFKRLKNIMKHVVDTARKIERETSEHRVSKIVKKLYTVNDAINDLESNYVSPREKKYTNA